MTKELKTFIDVQNDLSSMNTSNLMKLGQKSSVKDTSFLQELGFMNSKPVSVTSNDIVSISDIDHYNRVYHGMYKFISRIQLEELCKKYDLYVRSIDKYIGHIPDKNIVDMRNFSVYIDDLDTRGHNFKDEWYKDYVHVPIKKVGNFKVPMEYFGMEYMRLSEFICIVSVPQLLSDDSFDKGKGGMNRIYSQFDDEVSDRVKQEKRNEEALFRLENDPIVLCEVKGGYLVITAWDKEASDEIIVNTQFN